ncbi:putative heterokaryon incompatibility protein [Rosellinia necatrix]|uniref:Putative heterokaryon incompatibility protein n=1 Tax=Rosellinia necatrix TaxID=77044 RepID=A0A1W2TLS3_ROSNE|nr:putative heterokaryon incompatibility protein [Rosellinia necatrix]
MDVDEGQPDSGSDFSVDLEDPGLGSSTEPIPRLSRGLCSTCQSLRLGLYRFQVQTPVAASQGVRNASTGPVLLSSPTPRRLGTLIEIEMKASTCPLCALIYESANELRQPKHRSTEDDEDQQLPQAACFLTWEIDGRRDRPNPSRGRTRRIHIRWNHSRLPESYLVCVAPQSFSTTTSPDANQVQGRRSLFRGRKITEAVENLALVKSWLNLCQETHYEACRRHSHSNPRRLRDMAAGSYFGVIDVLGMNLTQLPFIPDPPNVSSIRRHDHVSATHKYEPYVALSYVWDSGGAYAYTTTSENVMLHRTPGSLDKVVQQLPATIRDAIDLVRRLGFRYLWIDRLCIVQDSPLSWKPNAYNMDVIYGNAELTICAADGDASAGLRALKQEDHSAKQCYRTVMDGLSLMAIRSPEAYIRQSTWSERAWTLQERLLSRRCLIFTNGRVYFQCRSVSMSEEIHADRAGARWSLDLAHTPVQMFRQIDTRAIWVYMRSVELYTERKLSQPRDILAAFSGVSNVLRGRMRAPFAHGLPSSHFDLALLWEPTQAVERRLIANSAEKQSYSIGDFPSWSWAGWAGPVAFNDNLVGGLLGDVSEWINKHTWIRWRVRDGRGDLRPLWECTAKADRSTDPRWRGYQTPAGWGGWQRRNPPLDDDRYQPEAGSRPVLEEDDDQDQDLDLNSNYRQNPRVSSIDTRSLLNCQLKREEKGAVVRSRSRSRSRSPRPHDDRGEAQEDKGRDRSPLRTRAPSPDLHVTRASRTEHPSRFSRGRMASQIPRTRSSSREDARRSSPPPPLRRLSTPKATFDIPTPGAEHADYLPQPRLPSHSPHPSDRFWGDRSEGFNITLKDYPYRVVEAPYTQFLESFELPLLPILQFRTWYTVLHVMAALDSSTDENQHTEGQGTGLGAGLARCQIADDAGDWVGSIVVDERWAARQPKYRHEFIAISEAKSFTEVECETWSYYIPKERDEVEWDLFYVLLIEKKGEAWERVGVGKVFKEAFQGARWKEIVLG